MNIDSQPCLDEVAAFVISLSSSPRNSEILVQLRNQGIHTTLIEAVDGRLWTEPFDRNLVDVNKFKRIIGRPPTGPEIGCALSHLQCAREAQEKNLRFALVLEEDAIITADLLSPLTVMDKIDSGKPMILQLYSPHAPVVRRDTFLRVDDNSGQFAAQFFMPPNAAVAYLMNRAAINIFSSRKTVEGVADWPPFANVVDFWGVFPSPVTHKSHGSAIEEQRVMQINKSRFRHRYFQIVETYFELFRLGRVREHSQSLGGLSHYFREVIIPHTSYRIRYFRSKIYESGDNEVTLR